MHTLIFKILNFAKEIFWKTLIIAWYSYFIFRLPSEKNLFSSFPICGNLTRAPETHLFVFETIMAFGFGISILIVFDFNISDTSKFPGIWRIKTVESRAQIHHSCGGKRKLLGEHEHWAENCGKNDNLFQLMWFSGY